MLRSGKLVKWSIRVVKVICYIDSSIHHTDPPPHRNTPGRSCSKRCAHPRTVFFAPFLEKYREKTRKSGNAPTDAPHRVGAAAMPMSRT